MTISNNKLLIGASGGGSDPINMEDVFSTFLYEGNGGTQTINNGIDIDGEGGLVWIKNRDATDSNVLTDTVRGATKILHSDTGDGEATDDDTITAFNSTGFAIGDDVKVNTNNESYCAWTFRKNPKFFDIVTYTGNGTAGRTVAHNLGSVPGCIMVKGLGGDSWHVYHRGNNNGTNPEDYYLRLNDTSVNQSNNPVWNDTAPTDSVFSLGEDGGINGDNATYVAYLFAHNNNDGEFGPSGDQDIIKCDKYSGGAASKVDINCGFEPSWVMIKGSNEASDWVILDNMRGVASISSGSQYLEANTNKAEAVATFIHFTPTGFQTQANNNETNAYGGQYTYIAIRRPDMATITDATEVFHVLEQAANVTEGTNITTGFPVDFQLLNRLAGQALNTKVFSRLQGVSSTDTASARYMSTSRSTQEASGPHTRDWDNTGFDIPDGTNEINASIYSWKRAKGFCDVVAYTGTGSNQTLNHSLGVVPEMMWFKRRNDVSNWVVYHKDGTVAQALYLDDPSKQLSNQTANLQSVPTTTQFVVGTSNEVNNANGSGIYIVYLFATLAGISKVGSVTHSGSSTDVDCGFSAGAKFVLLKRTDAAGDWFVWDSVRGIIAGNDPYLLLNSTAAEVTNTDLIDPLASGFQISGDFTDGDYIFYAIA